MSQPPGSNSLWSLATGSQPHERKALLVSFLYFFCVLAAYYMLRPLREQLAAAVGSTNLWPFWLGAFIAMLVLTPVFGWLVARFSRERFMPIIYGFFILGLLAFVPAFRAQDEIGPRLLGIVFYIWLSVFNLLVVSVFWSFMADIFDSMQARRLFPVIALGGTAGAIAGPLVALALPIESLLFAASGLLGLVLVFVYWLSAWARRHPSPDRLHESSPSEAIGGSIWGGLKQLFTTPFLRNMAAVMLLGDAIGTVAYALVADYAGSHYADREARKDFFAQVDLMTNCLVVVMQVGITRWILLRFGSAVGIVVPQVLNIVVLVAAALIGDMAIVAMLVITRAGAYGMHKPAMDSLYTRVSREARYKGKNVIDTTVWRFGDVVVSGGMALLAPFAIGVFGYGLAAAVAASCSGMFGWRAAHSPDLQPERDTSS